MSRVNEGRTDLAFDVRTTLISCPDAAAQIRAKVFLPLLRSGDRERAAIVNRTIIAAQPWKAQYRLDQLTIALDADDNTVIKAACSSLSLLPQTNGNFHIKALKALLKAGRTAAAAEFAEQIDNLWKNDADLSQLAMKALYRAGHRQSATAAATALARTSDLSIAVAVEAAIVLANMRQFKPIDDLLREVGTAQSEHPLALAMLAYAGLKIGRDEAEIRRLIEKARLLGPDDPRVINIVVDIVESFDGANAAIRILDRVPPDAITIAMQIRRADLMGASGRYAEAIEDYATLCEGLPDNRPLRRKFIGALTKMGHIDRARTIYEDGLVRRRADLGLQFEDAIARASETSAINEITEQRFSWCEVHLDPGLAHDSDWRRQAQTSADIDLTFLDWAECHPNRISEMFPFIEVSEKAKGLLINADAAGKGAFVTSAHVGILYAGPVALESFGHRSGWIASMPSIEGSLHQERLISTETASASQVVRGTLRALKENRVIALAIDGAAGQTTRTCKLFGVDVQLSDFCAQISYKWGTPCFFPRLVWTGSKVTIDMDEMPMAHHSESLEKFCTRWLASFVENLELMLQLTPHAIRGSGGFWRNIHD